MRLLKVSLLALMGAFSLSLQMNAQSCAELYKKANSLKESKKYAEAINYYQRAKSCDDNLKTDCNKWIEYCRKHLPVLEVSVKEIQIPYQGGDKKVDVTSTESWKIDGTNTWCTAKAYGNKDLVIQCREANNSTRSKSNILTIKSGNLYQSVRVVQEGRPEYIEVGAKSLSFPAEGTEDDVTIESNASWDVKSVPSWCKVSKKDDGIHISVTPNERVMERVDDIVVISPNNSVTIKLYQSAGNEQLSLSRNNLVLDGDGDVHYVKVYTDADNWFVGDYPTWMNVQRIGQDSIRIECGKNIPNGEPRTGSVKVRTDRQTVGVLVTQSPRLKQDLFFPDSKVVGGRNFSLGVSASYYLPFVSTSAGGDYVGSVLDYGLGTSAENASYKSTTGFSFGVFADIRLFKNIFLTAGINYSQIKYKNEFNQNTDYVQTLNNSESLRGDMQNSYKEEYTHSMLEIPILASYRFKVNMLSHVQVNFGPVLNFGLSAKMKLSGNSDCETMKKYATATGVPTDDYSNYIHHTAVNSEFNLYQPCVYWEETYTTGNDAAISHHDKFQEAPLSKVNCGLRIGAAYEWVGLSFGLSYTYMLTNMANKNYWENERWTILNLSNTTMKGYKHRLNTLEFKVAYTFRYFKSKK